MDKWYVVSYKGNGVFIFARNKHKKGVENEACEVFQQG